METSFQIYFQPKKENTRGMKSLTLYFYEFDMEHCTYREKIILEQNGEKYKIKKYIGAMPALKKQIESINFDDYKNDEEINLEDEYYFIKYGEKKIMTNRREKIENILKMFYFDKVLDYDLSEYKKVN